MERHVLYFHQKHSRLTTPEDHLCSPHDIMVRVESNILLSNEVGKGIKLLRRKYHKSYSIVSLYGGQQKTNTALYTTNPNAIKFRLPFHYNFLPRN
jgi:hypothetical protein